MCPNTAYQNSIFISYKLGPILLDHKRDAIFCFIL